MASDLPTARASDRGAVNRRYREADEDSPETPLAGGDVTEGLVRVGNTVRRPTSPTSSTVNRLLDQLAELGFEGAPRYLGVDGKARDVLTFVDGEVASRPWPQWVADDSRIVSVARLVRAYDDAAIQLGVPSWAESMRRADPPGTPRSIAGTPEFIGHLDITPENVVFRDGQATALIDFDLARPATRVEEVCNLLLWWSPWMPPGDREDALSRADPFSRASLLVDAYGLSPADRRRLVPVSRNAADRSWHLMKHRAEMLGGGWRRMWEEGVGDRIFRRQRWLADHQRELTAAVT